MINSSGIGFLLVLGMVVWSGCGVKDSELAWEKNLYAIGSHSSPRAADLNKDGVLDIVIGTAKGENIKTEMGILALNGENGTILWQQAAIDQVFGSATFYDVTQDGVSDVYIGGRSSQFKALDGSTGKILWEYQFQYEDHPVLKHARFNFYNSVLIPDQNNNGHPELLTVNGGNVKALPYSTENRYPGVMMVFDAKSGEILAADTMPDGKESYMSPVCYTQPGSTEYLIIYGTGGESISGNLYQARLSELMAGELVNSRLMASESGHGFIAPAVIADITGDQNYDIISISHASNVFAIDGLNNNQIWTRGFPGTESSNGLAVGQFNGDGIPDFFAVVSKGVWPASTSAIQTMIDGRTGEVEFQESLGCINFSSAVAYDINRDQRDEVILSYHEFDCQRDSTDLSDLKVETSIVAISLADHQKITIYHKKGFKNVFATPWIGDLDHDHYLDIVYSLCYSPNSNLLSFLGMSVYRISSNIAIQETPKWGGYMGTNGDGIFPK